MKLALRRNRTASAHWRPAAAQGGPADSRRESSAVGRLARGTRCGLSCPRLRLRGGDGGGIRRYRSGRRTLPELEAGCSVCAAAG